MKNIFILVSTLFCLSCGTPKESSTVKEAKTTPIDIIEFGSTITQDELKDMLYVYASDAFEGRETGEPGHEKAVNYIKDFYSSKSIAPLQSSGDYFQEVTFQQLFVPKVSTTINGTTLKTFDDIISLSPAMSASMSSDELFYVGYGIDDPNYSDFNNINVKGKILIAKAGEPQSDDGVFLVSGTKEKSKWSNGRQGRRSKQDAAKRMGAKALLFVDNAAFKYYSYAYKQRSENNASIGLSLGDGSTVKDDMPFMLLSESVLSSIDSNLMQSNIPQSIKADISLNQKNKSTAIVSNNVASIIRGSEFPNEYIIISAHSDHVGVNGDGEVYNGADDDGSGSVAILEIAEAFKIAESRGLAPRRSIIFLHVTGEEKGLLGSQYYTDIEPLVPLANTVANLNIDMIGRIDPKREGKRNYLYLIGSDKLSSELHTISETVNQKYSNIEFDYTFNDDNDPNRFYYRSDHYNFAKNNVPIIFYFNGTHEDYHQIGDTPDKIEYDLLENRSRLIFYTAWELANREERIKVDKTSK